MVSTHHVSRDFHQPRTDTRYGHQHPLCFILETLIDMAGDNAVEIAGNGSYVGRDRHFVVVEDNQQSLLQMPGLIDAFQCDAAG